MHTYPHTGLSHSLEDALIAAAQYCDLHPANACAWNLQGLLRERGHDFPTAAHCYATAADLLKQQQADIGGGSDTPTAVTEGACEMYVHVSRYAVCRHD